MNQVQYIDQFGYENLPVRRAFQENSQTYEIDLTEKLNVKCPVKILHGVLDESVPYKVILTNIFETFITFLNQNSLDIMDKIETNDVELLYRKSDGHSFTTAGGLDLLETSLLKTVNLVDQAM